MLQEEGSAFELYSVDRLRQLASQNDVICLSDWSTIKLPTKPEPALWKRMELAMEPSEQFRVS